MEYSHDDSHDHAASHAQILKTAAATAAAAGFPTIVPSRVFGQYAPSKRINIGAIGVGRISRGARSCRASCKYDTARIMAVCDLDANRVEEGKNSSTTTTRRKPASPTTASPDTPTITNCWPTKTSTPSSSARPTTSTRSSPSDAVRAGKDVYLQKPASLTIAEGRYLCRRVQSSGRILQIGSQQRSWKQFHRACELVRNGRIGEVKHVEVGLPGDPAGGDPTPMPVPAGFQYDAWLGSTPEVYYTVDRVHPHKDFSRPGWLRMEQFGAGMITGWGAHHVDTAHWGMNTEYTGPVEIWGTAEFPTHGLWDVHGKFLTHARYANGMTMDISGDFPNGIKFIGTKGWIFVTRDEMTTPTSNGAPAAKIEPLMASDPKILDRVIGPDEIHLYRATSSTATGWTASAAAKRRPPRSRSAIAPAPHACCTTSR